MFGASKPWAGSVTSPCGRCWALPHGLARPRELSAQLSDVLLGSLPLALTAGTAIGVVVWLHLRGTLESVAGPGAAVYLPQALALVRGAGICARWRRG